MCIFLFYAFSVFLCFRIVGSNRSQTIISNQNSLVVQFKTNGNGSNYFRAEYGIGGYPLCNDQVLYDKANVSVFKHKFIKSLVYLTELPEPLPNELGL